MGNLYITDEEVKRILSSIKPDGQYYLVDLVKKKLIPGVKTYEQVYSLVHLRVPYSKNKTGFKHVLADETSKKTIKAYHEGRPGREVSGKLFVLGSDIIIFLKLNGVFSEDAFSK